MALPAPGAPCDETFDVDDMTVVQPEDAPVPSIGVEPVRSIEVEIVNRLGLHARAAAKFVKTLSAYGADVTVSHQGQSVSGRSIMGLMMLAAGRGMTITLDATGADANEALGALSALIAGRFHEDD